MRINVFGVVVALADYAGANDSPVRISSTWDLLKLLICAVSCFLCRLWKSLKLPRPIQVGFEAIYST